MIALVVTGTVGAGVGLAISLAFNLRLARELGAPLGASLVNFVLGASFLLALWSIGVDGAFPANRPEGWMFAGGFLGAVYVSLSLASATRLGAAVSSVATTLGQVVGALVLAGNGWLGQDAQRVTPAAVASAALLIVAVGSLAADRMASRSNESSASDRTDVNETRA